MKSENLPIPGSTIFSDLDNTIVRNGFQTNSDHLPEAVSEAISRGYYIGLSSDTPYNALEEWRDRFSMNGPIIAEKGAIVGTETGLMYNRDDENEYLKSIENIRDILSNIGFKIWNGNPVDALRTNLHIGVPGDKIAMVNTLRKCSLGLFFRVTQNDGSLSTDPSVTRLAVDNIRHLYPNFDLDEDYNEKHGLIIVTRKGTNKRSGTIKIMENQNINKVGMIGDSISDYLGSDIAIHYAVENATEHFKEKSDYVSSEELTLGVIEILESLLK